MLNVHAIMAKMLYKERGLISLLEFGLISTKKEVKILFNSSINLLDPQLHKPARSITPHVHINQNQVPVFHPSSQLQEFFLIYHPYKFVTLQRNMDPRASTVNLNVIPNLISQEDIRALSANTFSHNDLQSDDSEEEDEILENDGDDDDEHQYEIGQQFQFHGNMGAGPSTFSQFQSSTNAGTSTYPQFHGTMSDETSTHYMEPPAPEFINVSWANQAVDSQWVQQQVQLENTNGNLYVGAQFATKAELIYAVKMYHIEAHAQYKVTHSDHGRLILKCRR